MSTEEIKQFASLFAGLTRAYQKINLTDEFVKKGGGRKRVVKAWWVDDEVTLDVYAKHLAGEQGIGISPLNDQNECVFGVIDIDQYDWSDEKLVMLCKRLSQIPLPLVPAKSKSGGIRLYLFCEPVPGALVKQYLSACRALLGLAADTEIFPKTINIVKERNDHGYAIMLPYFDSLKTICYGFKGKQKLTLTDFILRALTLKQSAADLKKIPSLNITDAGKFEDGPPCLQLLAANGIAEGGRSTVLFNMGVYAKLKFGEDSVEKYLDEFNSAFMQPPLSSSEIVTAVKSVKKKSYFYTCTTEPVCNFCNKDLCLTRKYGVGNSTNTELNVHIEKVTKLNTQPPMWLVVVNGRTLDMETEELMYISKFTKVCIEQLNIIPQITAKRFQAMLAKVLSPSAITVIEAPEEASHQGQLIELLDKYLHASPPALVRDELIYHKPWYENGYVHFQGQDFMDFLEMEKFKVMDKRRVFKWLREFNISEGGEPECHKVLRIATRTVRVWRIKYEKPQFTEDLISAEF